ncbi:Centrosomal of 76 kDa [Paramuricea clavata]|uniref:Centrosomal of 76 kDa n=1 Tax=Paramuricea clavata TaxID=317549 RepID=A0A7D9HF26_PARCT|nr:Centrosomal of 76 kDa [Paramuricea clavata]
MANLPTEKVNELKQLIHSHLNQTDVHSKIKSCLDDSFGAEADARSGAVDENAILNILRERGVINDVMRTLKFEGVGSREGGGERERVVDHSAQKTNDDTTHAKVSLDPTKRYLYLQVLGGKAFLEHLQEPEPLPGQPTSMFTLHLHFKGQRFRSRPAACSCEPDIHEGFLLELQKDRSKIADAVNLLSVPDQIHILLIKTNPSGEKNLVGSHSLKWRTILAAETGCLRNSIEINGVGTEAKVPVGVLEMKLEIIPRLSQILQKDVVRTQEDLEHGKIAERERLFLVYAKQWWREFLQIRPQHSDRLVKIFAQDETGTNRLTCSFVKPIRAGRLIDSAREAARFVSLIAYEKTENVGGGRTEMWCNMHSFLCKNKGDCEDHVILLCNLLLGFGLDAYVTIGTKGKGVAHSWVTTVSPSGEVVFWESLTAQRYIHRFIDPDDPPLNKQLPKPEHPYQTVGCIFNHRAFYANCQPSDRVDVCQFDLPNKSLWKAMSEDAIRSVCGNLGLPTAAVFPPLCPSSIDATTTSNHLEYSLRSLVEDLRQDMGLSTVWDDELSYLLTPALAGYELEHQTGLSVGNEEFQHAIRKNVPDGHTFKGFPIQFVHMNPRRALGTCLRSPVCEEIIRCQGDHVRHALRVRVYPYPESTCAVWIMFACKYRSVL